MRTIIRGLKRRALSYAQEQLGRLMQNIEERPLRIQKSDVKTTILSALRRRSHEKVVKFDKIIDEAIDIAREYDRSVPYETLLYRARKITDIGGNVIAAVVVLLQDIPSQRLEEIVNSQKEGEIAKLKGSIIKVLKRFRELKDFSFNINEANKDPEYIEGKMKELIRSSRYFETILLFFFDRLQNARRVTNPKDPILDQIRYLYAPLADRMQFIFLADDFRDQYLRVRDPQKYNCIENDVVRKRIGMNYDEAKLYLRSFAAGLHEFLIGSHFELSQGISNVFWRVKSPFSIWNKVEVRRKYGYDRVFDILAIKIVCRTKQNIRDVAEVLTKEFNVPAKNIEDNLTTSRESGWQAYTIVVFDQEGRPIEIQLMTEEMDYHNTFLRAATWEYNLKKDLTQIRIDQEFDVAVAGILNGDAEKNFYRLYHHWAA